MQATKHQIPICTMGLASIHGMLLPPNHRSRSSSLAMQQMGSSKETASGTPRPSPTLPYSGSWSIKQQPQLYDHNPFTNSADNGQRRTSLKSLAEDPFWQQKRDERKSSLQQQGFLDVPTLLKASVSASTAKSEVIALGLSQSYQSERNSSTIASSDNASSQHAYGQGSIPALRMPSRASRQDAVLWNESSRTQLDHEALDAGSMRHQSRQGSAVRFAVDKGHTPSGPRRSTHVFEVCSAAYDDGPAHLLKRTNIPVIRLAASDKHGSCTRLTRLPLAAAFALKSLKRVLFLADSISDPLTCVPCQDVPSTPSQAYAFDTLEAQIMFLRQGSRSIPSPAPVHGNQSTKGVDGIDGAQPLSASQGVLPSGHTSLSREAQVQSNHTLDSSHAVVCTAAPSSHEPEGTAMSRPPANQPQTGSDTLLQHLESPPVAAEASYEGDKAAQSMSLEAEHMAPQTQDGSATAHVAQPRGVELQGEAQSGDWRVQQRRWLATSSGLADAAGLQLKPESHISADPATRAQSEVGLHDRSPGQGNQQRHPLNPIKVSRSSTPRSCSSFRCACL